MVLTSIWFICTRVLLRRNTRSISKTPPFRHAESPVSAVYARVGDRGRIDDRRRRDDHGGGRDDRRGGNHGGGIDRWCRVDRWGRSYDVVREAYRGGSKSDDAGREAEAVVVVMVMMSPSAVGAVCENARGSSNRQSHN